MRSSGFAARGPGRLLLALLMLAAIPACMAQNSLAAGMPAFPALTGPVVDDAHLLPGDVFQQLSQRLADYAQANGTQVVVVTLPTLNGYPIREYGYQLGRHWAIGQKSKNNGVLLIIDVGEKQVDIEVGYGLEGTLTDAQSFLIIHNLILPRFRQGDFAGGISAGTNAIFSVLGGHPLLEQQQVRERGGTGFLMFLILLFVFLPLLRAVFGRGGYGYRGYGGGWLGWLALGMLSSGRGGGFGGGGFGGGGFGGGGFSGGGGSFGGGGASGGW
ncbi:MAG TPA: TPM domain-containing protein [Steroidobacteraceae bacterium]|nr:TPM domain-containing protein [Steroidobacteraceae bacterium]